jgi:hypothetical protein
MLVAAVGIFPAIGAHIATVVTGLARTIRLHVLSCTSVGATTAGVWWLM